MKTYFIIFLLFIFSAVSAQQQDRFQLLEQRLNELSQLTPGLNEKIELSVSGASIQEFLRGLAEANSLNISVDPNLTIKIYNNFKNEKVSNILMFLVREYGLDIKFIGTIMSISRFDTPPPPKPVIPAKEILARYNSPVNTLTLDLKKDTLSNVVRKITQISKKNVIMASGISDRLVSVYIEDMPFDNALEKMAFANDLSIKKTDDNFYIISIRNTEEEKAPPVASNKKPGGFKNPAKTIQSAGAKDAEIYIDIVDSLGKKFISVDATGIPIADVIKSVAEELDIDYFMFSDIKGNTTSKVHKVGFGEFLSYLLQGTDYTYKNDHGLFLIGERKLEGLRANRVIQLQYRSVDLILDVIPAEIKKGVEIKEFRELNSILLTGALPQILEIEAFINQLDKVIPMVMIEVIMMDVRKGRTTKTGISAGISDTMNAGGTLLPGVDFTLSSRSVNDILGRLGLGNTVNLGRVSPNFYVNLSAMEQNNNIEVRSMPKLSTLNGHDANLSIGSTRYYSITTQNVLGSLQPQTVVTQQFNAVQANLTINIKPMVSGDDQVTLNIDVNISDFIGDPPENAPPPSATSQFKSIVRVKNEEMVVLGGLERLEKSEQGNGLPILSRIPILKYIFSSRTRSRNKVVSIVFIKPTIIY
ncbi:MAG: type II secretion system protein GspD [Cytophagaceae bacterium]